MTAMFPDSGVPWTDAKNSLPKPVVQSDCDPLWYSTSRCQPRFDPAAANAMLAELINLINKGEVSYDCDFLDQVQLAVRYLIQRGLPRGGYMAGGPQYYTTALDPTATRYNDYMTLSVVPVTTNSGPVRWNIDGLGFVPVYRNDGQELQYGDLPAGYPEILVYYQGAFYVPYLVRSQVQPAVLSGVMADSTGFGEQGFGVSVPGGEPIAYYHVNKNTMKTSTWDGINLTVGAGEAGVWSVYGAIHTDKIGVENEFSEILIFVNGIEAATESLGTVVAGAGTGLSCAAPIQMNVGDVMQIRFYQQSGVTMYAVPDNRTQVSALLVSR